MLDKELQIDKQIVSYAISFLVGLVIGIIVTYLLIPKAEIKECVEQALETKEQHQVHIEEDIESFDSIVSLPQGQCNTMVDIAGAVNKPGVYCFEPNSTIMDAVERAKGFANGGAHKYISMRMNLSKYLENNQKIYIPFETDVYCELRSIQIVDVEGVPAKDAVVEPNNPPDEGSNPLDCININTATKDQLTTLSGVGESTATKIIEGRPYSETKEIMNVPGIGEATFEKLKNFICV